MLDEEEAQRDVIRKKILEESRLEDIRVEEELRLLRLFLETISNLSFLRKISIRQ